MTEREVHTPTDDEREALLAEADALVASWDQKGSWSPDSPVGMVMRLAANLRRSEGPEASAEHDRDHMGICSKCGRGLSAIDLLDGEGPCVPREPQGEPSDDQVQAAYDAFYLSEDRTGGLTAIREALRAAFQAGGEGR